MRTIIILALLLGGLPACADAQRLFVGLEGSAPVTRSSDLAGFPDVVYQPHFAFDVSGAAATPEGLLYLCNGAFTTHLYSATLESSPTHLATISVDISALAYGQGTLWGYSNYATPKGIYEIDPVSGAATLVLDVYTGESLRFFALDYNAADGLLYGYSEYGNAGIYSLNLQSGEMIRLAGTIPASNGQGRAMAVGNNTAFLTATRGDDNIPCFAYDLSQGVGGTWVPFTNPYPAYHSTGGAAWIPDPTADLNPTVPARGALGFDLERITPNPATGPVGIQLRMPQAGDACLRVFDMSGRCLARHTYHNRPAGVSDLTWDGRDLFGTRVPAGTYVIRVETDHGARSSTLRLVR